MDDQQRKDVLGEVLMDELKAIRDYVQIIPSMNTKIDQIDERLKVVETDVKAVKGVVKFHDREIKQLQDKLS